MTCQVKIHIVLKAKTTHTHTPKTQLSHCIDLCTCIVICREYPAGRKNPFHLDGDSPPNNVKEPEKSAPKPDDIKEPEKSAPEPDNVKETEKSAPEPDDIKEPEKSAPKPDDIKEPEKSAIGKPRFFPQKI